MPTPAVATPPRANSAIRGRPMITPMAIDMSAAAALPASNWPSRRSGVLPAPPAAAVPVTHRHSGAGCDAAWSTLVVTEVCSPRRRQSSIPDGEHARHRYACARQRSRRRCAPTHRGAHRCDVGRGRGRAVRLGPRFLLASGCPRLAPRQRSTMAGDWTMSQRRWRLAVPCRGIHRPTGEILGEIDITAVTCGDASEETAGEGVLAPSGHGTHHRHHRPQQPRHQLDDRWHHHRQWHASDRVTRPRSNRC